MTRLTLSWLSPPIANWSWRLRAPIMAGVVLVAFALRLHDLARWDLTFDESASAWISRKPALEMIQYLLGAIHEHPPTYYLSLRAWTMLAGDNEFMLRFWSVVAGVASVPLLYAWVKRMLGHGVALIAALLLALSPFHIYYSQDARMYPWLGVWVLLSLISFDRILRDGRRRWWVVWGGVTLLGLSTHYFMAFINVVETLYLLIVRRQHGAVLRRWIALHATIVALGSAWILISPGLRMTLERLFSDTNDIELIRSLRMLSFDIAFGPFSRLSHEWLWTLLLMAGVGLVLAIRARPSRIGWLIAALMFIPPLLVLLTPEVLASRYVLYIVFGYVTALAIVAVRVARRFPLAGAALVIVFAATGVSRYVHQWSLPKSEYGDTIAYMQTRWRDGDMLVLNGPWQWVQLAYYDPGVPRVYLPPRTPPALDPIETEPVLESLAHDYRRIWVIEAALDSSDPERFLLSWMNEHTFAAGHRRDLNLYYTSQDSMRMQPVETLFGDVLELQQVALPAQAVESGDALLVGMYWRVEQALGVDLDATLALFGQDDAIWAERIFSPGQLFSPPRNWQPGDEPIDRQALTIPTGTPPGKYSLRLNVRRTDSGALTVPNAFGDVWLTLAELDVMAPLAQLDAVLPGVAQDAVFDDDLRLLSVAPSGDRFSQGGWISFDALWSASAMLPADLMLDIALARAGEPPIMQATQPLAPAWYPTSRWPAAQVTLGRYFIQIPPQAPAGRYEIQVSLHTPNGDAWPVAGHVRRESLFGLVQTDVFEQDTRWTAASVEVEAIPREFALPAPQHSVDARFGDQFRLLGYDIDAESIARGGALSITLYWQALQSIGANYTSFTHVRNGAGVLAGQSDHWPRNWTYPTSYWAQGEVIADEYHVLLDSNAETGAYEILIGWYDSATVTRLAAFNADDQPVAADQIPLTTLTITP